MIANIVGGTMEPMDVFLRLPRKYFKKRTVTEWNNTNLGDSILVQVLTMDVIYRGVINYKDKKSEYLANITRLGPISYLRVACNGYRRYCKYQVDKISSIIRHNPKSVRSLFEVLCNEKLSIKNNPPFTPIKLESGSITYTYTLTDNWCVSIRETTNFPESKTLFSSRNSLFWYISYIGGFV